MNCIILYESLCIKTFIDLLVQTSYLKSMEITPQEKAPLINLKRSELFWLKDFIYEIPMKKIGRVRCSFLTGRKGLVRLELSVKDLARSPQRLAFPMPI